MTIAADRVHDVLRRHQLVDGYPVVVDLEKSHGPWLHDAKTGREYFDAFTCFASWPIGYNHPMMEDEAFRAELLTAALTKIANADLYTSSMASFVDTFSTHVTPASHPYHFWISGGSLAVENAMKVAFDWKARKLGRTDFHENVNDLVIMHFKHAFHGRSGYTLSVTNTLPDKVGLFPQFQWPRITPPAMEFDLDGGVANEIEAAEKATYAEMEAAFARHRGKVAAILIEPLQAEGGDHHFRPEFMRKLRLYADEEEAMLIFDEVQTGFFGTGTPWLWQQYDVEPDVVSFGKKTQICGIYSNRRVDEVDDNVFHRSSRINSTWGGSLVDMVRCRRFIEIIEHEKLANNIAEQGARCVEGLRRLARETGAFRNVRGRGSLIAFTADSPDARQALIHSMFERQLMALPCGKDSVRFRLPLTVSANDVDTMLERVAESVPASV